MNDKAKYLYSVKDCSDLSINSVWKLYKNYVNPGQVELISSFGFGQELIKKAQGCWLETRDGKRILDFTGGIGVLNHGHNHPRILQARKDFQEHSNMEVHKNYFSPYLAALSHNIAQLLPGDLNYSYFPNSGAEAVEGAVKMAYKYHQGNRRVILHSDISYHGKLLGAGSISASRELHFRFPEIPGAKAFVYNDIDSIREQLQCNKTSSGESDIFAIILEPMSASSLLECTREFLQELRQLCDENRIVLIFDEVFSGWAKSGSMFYFMQHDVLPDIVVTSKALGGGKASIAGYVARTPIFMQAYGQLADTMLHSTTYNGFGEECITAIEALNIIVEDDYPRKAQKIFRLLNDGLLNLQQEYPHIITQVRGSGALNGVLLNTGPELLKKITGMVPGSFFQDQRFLQKLVTASVINELYNKHQILTYYGENREIVLMASPSLIIEKEEIELFLTALRDCFSKGLLKICINFIQSKLFAKFLIMSKSV